MNELAPHDVVIWLKAEVREVLPTGETSGNIAHTTGNEWKPYRFRAEDKNIAIRQLNEFLQELSGRGI